MPKKSPTGPKPDGFDMFVFATLYYEAAIELHVVARDHHFGEHQNRPRQNKTLWGLFIPSSVLLALSFEVYLKCLKRLRGKMPVTGHNTEDLYGALSLKDRRLIKRQFREHRKRFKSSRPKVTLASVFNRTKRYFEKMRYAYEVKPPRLLSDTKASGAEGLDDAVEAVRWVILQSRPGWHQRYLDLDVEGLL